MTRVLVVEDEPHIAFALEADLTTEGYAPTVVGTGPDASGGGRAEPFDLVLLDVMLPGKDGFDVAANSGAPGRRCRSSCSLRAAQRRKGDGARPRCGRLRDEALRPARTARADPRRSAAVDDGATTAATCFVSVTPRSTSAGQVRRSGTVVDLSAIEFKLLSTFIKGRGRLFTRDNCSMPSGGQASRSTIAWSTTTSFRCAGRSSRAGGAEAPQEHSRAGVSLRCVKVRTLTPVRTPTVRGQLPSCRSGRRWSAGEVRHASTMDGDGGSSRRRGRCRRRLVRAGASGGSGRAGIRGSAQGRGDRSRPARRDREVSRCGGALRVQPRRSSKRARAAGSVLSATGSAGGDGHAAARGARLRRSAHGGGGGKGGTECGQTGDDSADGNRAPRSVRDTR